MAMQREDAIWPGSQAIVASGCVGQGTTGSAQLWLQADTTIRGSMQQAGASHCRLCLHLQACPHLQPFQHGY